MYDKLCCMLSYFILLDCILLSARAQEHKLWDVKTSKQSESNAKDISSTAIVGHILGFCNPV